MLLLVPPLTTTLPGSIDKARPGLGAGAAFVISIALLVTTAAAGSIGPAERL